MPRLSRRQKFDAVFGEFRRVGGDRFSTFELMRLATVFIESFEIQRKQDLEIAADQRRGFQELAVDVAIKDGGWRLLSQHSYMFDTIFDPDTFIPESARLKSIPSVAQIM